MRRRCRHVRLAGAASWLLLTGLLGCALYGPQTAQPPQRTAPRAAPTPLAVAAAVPSAAWSPAPFMLALSLQGALSRAQTPAIRTDLNVYAEPAAPPLPRAGGKFTDPVFGTEVLRVTDEAGGANAGTAYSYWPTFNRDNTKLLVQREGQWAGTIYAFDPANFTLGTSYLIPRFPDGTAIRGEDAVWSAADPNILYAHTDSGAKLWAYNVETRTFKLVGDLTRRLLRGESLYQMSKADDDDTFAFTRRGPAPGYGYLGYIVYQASTDTILRQGNGPTDECQLDKTGRFLVWKTGQQGVGQIEVKILDVRRGTLTDLTDDAPDHAPGHSDNGHGFIVGAANYANAILRRNLSTPHQFTKIFDFRDSYDNVFHVSLRADNEDWALISFYGVATQGALGGRLRRELVQLATDGSGRVRRLLHHHSVALEYTDTPRANISRDGRFIAFTSNWGGRKRHDLFIARITPAPALTPHTRPRRASGPGQ